MCFFFNLIRNGFSGMRSIPFNAVKIKLEYATCNDCIKMHHNLQLNHQLPVQVIFFRYESSLTVWIRTCLFSSRHSLLGGEEEAGTVFLTMVVLCRVPSAAAGAGAGASSSCWLLPLSECSAAAAVDAEGCEPKDECLRSPGQGREVSVPPTAGAVTARDGD